MPAPFPGMDPFLESEEWEDFHTRFNAAVSEALASRVEPRYVVRIERRVYVEHATGEEDSARRADVAVLVSDASAAPWMAPAGSAVATLAPVECVLTMPVERRETYLVIRDRATREVVTVMETLSPANKRRGGDGRREYLEKREEVLQSPSHLVEVDLLRAGERLPTENRLPTGDYYAIVSRRHRRPRAEAYAWTIRDPLPIIPIPLLRGDPDVPLDLQTVFATVYVRARYDLSVDYTRPLDPPLTGADAAWWQQRWSEGQP